MKTNLLRLIGDYKMRTKEEMEEKIEKLNDITVALRAEEDNLSNEQKVILAGSELQSIMLTSLLINTEEQTRELLEKFERRAEELDAKYVEASEANNAELKARIHGMIWTNDIRLDTIKWVLEVEPEVF
jgi:organic radical activating enzyme